MYLQELAGHDNIIRLTNIIRAENDKDIFLVFEYMGEDCVYSHTEHVGRRSGCVAAARLQMSSVTETY